MNSSWPKPKGYQPSDIESLNKISMIEPTPRLTVFKQSQFSEYGYDQINCAMAPNNMIKMDSLPNNMYTCPNQMMHYQMHCGNQTSQQFYPMPLQQNLLSIQNNQWMGPLRPPMQYNQQWQQQQQPPSNNRPPHFESYCGQNYIRQDNCSLNQGITHNHSTQRNHEGYVSKRWS